jgi:hypothetical protein
MARRTYAGLASIIVIALLIPLAPALAHEPAGTDPVTGQPGLSTQQWAEIEAQAEAARQRMFEETGAWLAPAATPALSSIELSTPTEGSPETAVWNGTLTFNPDNPGAGPHRGSDPCQEPECEEFTLTVPEGSGALYVKTAWDRPDYGLYLYIFDPDDEQHGLDIQDRGPHYDKRPGHSTALPISQTTIADPQSGEWRIRVRAAWGIEIDYSALATVTAEPPIEWEREDPIELSKWATHKVPVNIVLSGFTLTDEQIAEVREHLPDQYHLSVLWWQFEDGGPGDSIENEENNCVPLQNWGRCHYSGTYSEQEREAGGNVPYFLPVRMEYEYHFLEASEEFTRTAFGKMKELTEEAVPYRSSSQVDYLSSYNVWGGRFRGPDRQVVDTSSADMIDALAFEDWLFETRFDWCEFTDLETGEVITGGFISPDPDAYYDPYYDAHGQNLAHMPQGRNEGLTIFFFDTFTPEYADEYFNPNRYHNFTTKDHFVDVDTGAWTGIDYGRVWGGRYRFAFFDLGAAPNYQESTAWPNGAGGGSADPPRGDPPIWDYANNPFFQGRFEERGIARNVTTMLFSRMTSGFLYRPIPRDIYQMTTTNFSDYYSRPPHGTWWTDLELLYDEEIAARWLSSAIPFATFRSGLELDEFEPYLYPSCSDERVGSKSNLTGTVVMAPDPTCVGEEPDPFQQMVEEAKAQGEDVLGAGIPFSQAVSATVARTFWEYNRDQYAPIGDGVYSFININAVFEGAYTWYLPAIVGGVAYDTPHRESWGMLQNANDRFKPVETHDCEQSRPGAPGCDGVPPLPTHTNRRGLTYVVGHEASHALGLLHPHDFLGVSRNEAGEWDYYHYTLSWMPDSTMSPTTYFAAIAPYGVWDQDNLMRGQSGEYIRMAEDAIYNAYLEAGRQGISSIDEAPDVVQRRDRMIFYLERGRSFFAEGDYLQAVYSFKNAYLAADGVTGAEVEPRLLQPGERVLFQTSSQGGPSRDEAVAMCGPLPAAADDDAPLAAPTLPATGGGGLLALLGLLLAVTAARTRRATLRLS